MQGLRKSSTGTSTPNQAMIQSTSTPSRRSAPNLSAMLNGAGSEQDLDGSFVGAGNDELTAELDLSGEGADASTVANGDQGGNEGGGGGDDGGGRESGSSSVSGDTSTGFLPSKYSTTRVVRIVSKQSNV